MGFMSTGRIAILLGLSTWPLAALRTLWWRVSFVAQFGIEVELGVTVKIEIGIFPSGLDIGLVPWRRACPLFAATAATATTASPPATALAIALSGFIARCFKLTRLCRP